MDKAVTNSNERYLLHLFARALNGAAPRDIPADCAWETVYGLAAQNGVLGLVWEAAKHLDSSPNGRRSTWEQVASSVFIRNVQLDADRAEIVERLAERGVSYLVLKGAALLPHYPSLSMRSMSDNDVLFGYVEADSDGGYRVRGASEEERATSLEEAGHVVRAVMLDMGYTVLEHSGDVCDIQFSKAPYYRYEMHFALMERHRPYYFYFANPWKRAVPVGVEEPEKGREFRFSDEDQYVYMIVHAYKHENMGGEGIRILGDIAISLRAAGEGFDLAYVEEELSQSRFTPEGFELGVGRQLPPLKVRTQSGALVTVGGTIDRVDEENLGGLFYFFQFACYLSAELLGVNPFDQPGVEAYKGWMFRALGKPGA